MKQLNSKMINEMLRETLTENTPDRADRIIRAAKGKNTAPTVSIVQEKYERKYLKPVLAVAAAAALIFAVITTAIVIEQNKVYATVTVESDVCLEVDLNRRLRPVAIRTMGAPADELVEQAKKTDTLDTSIDVILDGMVEDGYLDEDSNTVLITVDAPEDTDALLDRAFTAANDSFSDSGYPGAILTTAASDDAEVQRIARRYHISVGKAVLVDEINSKSKRYRVELLCRLSVNDLNLLCEYNGILYDHVSAFGSSCGCISPEEAISFACTAAGMHTDHASATLEVDLYGLYYSVYVRSGDTVYRFFINAQDGGILSEADERWTSSSGATTAPTAGTDSTALSESSSQPTVAPGVTVTAIGEEPADREKATEGETQNPTEKKQNTPKPTPKPTQKPTQKPAPQPTQKPTQKPAPAPTRPEPSAFSADMYVRYDGGIRNAPPSAAARKVSIRRVVNGYDTYYDHTNFPYAASGQQGTITALVCNTTQFRRLTGRSDNRFDDNYFKTHVLYIYMSRDVSYHWIKSIRGAYMENGTLYLENSEPIGQYITTDKNNPERIYTVIYELNKSELSDFVGMTEYVE